MLRLTFIFILLVPCIQWVQAQKMPSTTSKWIKDVQIDGNLTEWGDSLDYYFEHQDLYFSFANDEEYLYVAIKVADKDKQVQAVLNGLNVMINKEGKKREGPSLLFPFPDRIAFRTLSQQEFDKPDDLREAALSSIRALYVKGFPSLLDGAISLENTYGIKAATLIDSAGNLCYESAIRLSQLNITEEENSFAINVKINGIIRSQYKDYGSMGYQRRSPYGYNPYGYGYQDRGPRTITTIRQEPGAWQFLTLANKPY